MVRGRLVVLAIVAALIAPSMAPCLAAAPDQGMACCPAPGDATPQARPCCDAQPAAPAAGAVTSLHAVQPYRAATPFTFVLASGAARSTVSLIPSFDVRRLSTVLLI